METIIDVPDRVWGKVKDYATVERLSLSSAVEFLLKIALSKLDMVPICGVTKGHECL